MQSTKELFQSNKSLFPWWKGVVEDARFQTVLLHASKAMFEAAMTEQQQVGAKTAIGILTDFAEVPDAGFTLPRPNFRHMAEPLPEPPQPPEPEKKKRK